MERELNRMKRLPAARHNLIVAIGCYGWQLVQDTATHRMWLRKDGQRKSAGAGTV